MTKKTHDFFIEGTAQWAKLFEHNKDDNVDFHGEGGAYTVDVLIDKENMDKFTESGSRVKPKLGEDGISIRFKRKHNHPTIPELGGPPKVVDAEGNDWDPEVAIGNDSKVRVAFSVYETRMGKGTRLNAVRVLELVEYDGETSGETKLPEGF